MSVQEYIDEITAKLNEILENIDTTGATTAANNQSRLASLTEMVKDLKIENLDKFKDLIGKITLSQNSAQRAAGTAAISQVKTDAEKLVTLKITEKKMKGLGYTSSEDKKLYKFLSDKGKKNINKVEFLKKFNEQFPGKDISSMIEDDPPDPKFIEFVDKFQSSSGTGTNSSGEKLDLSKLTLSDKTDRIVIIPEDNTSNIPPQELMEMYGLSPDKEYIVNTSGDAEMVKKIFGLTVIPSIPFKFAMQPKLLSPNRQKLTKRYEEKKKIIGDIEKIETEYDESVKLIETTNDKNNKLKAVVTNWPKTIIDGNIVDLDVVKIKMCGEVKKRADAYEKDAKIEAEANGGNTQAEKDNKYRETMNGHFEQLKESITGYGGDSSITYTEFKEKIDNTVSWADNVVNTSFDILKGIEEIKKKCTLMIEEIGNVSDRAQIKVRIGNNRQPTDVEAVLLDLFDQLVRKLIEYKGFVENTTLPLGGQGLAAEVLRVLSQRELTERGNYQTIITAVKTLYDETGKTIMQIKRAITEAKRLVEHRKFLQNGGMTRGVGKELQLYELLDINKPEEMKKIKLNMEISKGKENMSDEQIKAEVVRFRVNIYKNMADLPYFDLGTNYTFEEVINFDSEKLKLSVPSEREEVIRRIKLKMNEINGKNDKTVDTTAAVADPAEQERLKGLDAESTKAQAEEKERLAEEKRLKEAQTQSQAQPSTNISPVVSQPETMGYVQEPIQDQSQEPVSTEKHTFFDETPVQPGQPEQPEQPTISEQPVTSEQPEQPETPGQPGPKTFYLHGTIKFPGSPDEGFEKKFKIALSLILDISTDKIKIRISHGSIIVDYEISGDENELKTLKTKISLLPQNSIVVDGIISEEITEPKIDDVTGEEESVEQPKEEPVDYSQGTDYDVDLFAENEITITEKELDELIVEKIKQEYKIKILKDQLTKYVELDPEKLIHENGEYRHTVKELEQKLFDIAEDKTINSKNSFKGATDLKKMNAKLIDYIKNMRKEVDGIDFDLIDDLLIENRSVVEKVNKSDKKKKTMKGSKKVTFY